MSDDTEFVRSNHAAIWGGAGATAYAPLPICTASLNQTAEINAVLADPRTWIWSADGDNRMVMTMTTGHADQLLGR